MTNYKNGYYTAFDVHIEGTDVKEQYFFYSAASLKLLSAHKRR